MEPHKHTALKWLMIIACIFITRLSYCQDKLSGQIFEYKTRHHLPDIKIENLNTHATAVSDTAGKFTIVARAGDRIIYSGLAYMPDTVYLTNLKYTEVFLQLQMLNEVKITSTKTQLGSFALPPPLSPFGGRTLVYTTDGAGNPIGGLTLKLFNGGDKKKRNRYAQKREDEELELKIAQIFSANYLKNFLPISGQEMTNFIILYTPNVKTYRSLDNLTLYINNCYKEFIKIPIEKRQSKEYLDLNNIK